MGAAKYRRHVDVGRRSARGTLRYSDAEWQVIVEAAQQAGMRPTAWVHAIGVETARLRSRASGLGLGEGETETVVSELRQVRRVLANVGGNLNDLARATNATGEAESLAVVQAVLRVVRSAVLSVDETVGETRRRLAG